ncbi:hypothetical protein BIW11_04716 [Tropilaelaps mercedesae]|uniref:Uncharacterized protein n=1 Tax=Tropilaelaps mercedesae TaxID=418985 RepID=A0A1V9X2R1_9ACAR|nr:hypothetical protein BIW11_04716 [Tropilaelaps mercedesae]
MKSSVDGIELIVVERGYFQFTSKKLANGARIRSLLQLKNAVASTAESRNAEMSTLTHNAREITGGRSHIRSGLSLYARYKASPTVLRGGTIAESKKNRVKKPFKKSEVSSKHPENPASMPQIDPITSETMIPSPIVSDLTSEEIEESYRIYKEAVQLGLVPTSKDIEENVALATKWGSIGRRIGPSKLSSTLIVSITEHDTIPFNPQRIAQPMSCAYCPSNDTSKRATRKFRCHQVAGNSFPRISKFAKQHCRVLRVRHHSVLLRDVVGSFFHDDFFRGRGHQQIGCTTLCKRHNYASRRADLSDYRHTGKPSVYFSLQAKQQRKG